MDYLVVINQIVILFIIIIVGFIASKKNILNSNLNKGLSDLLLNVTLPLLIFTSFNFEFSKDLLKTSLEIFLVSWVIFIFSIFFSNVLFYKYKGEKKDIMRFTAVFSNCGFMGYPIVSSIYGDIGVFYAAIFNITFNILIWTYGLALFTGENEYKNIKKVIYNPGIIAVILGLIMFMFSIKIPSNLFNALDLVGSTTIPLSMLIIGSSLSKMKFKDMVNGKDVYYSSFVRLILLPLIVLFVMKLLNLSDLVIGIAVIITAMPAAANTTVFAEKFGKNASFASKCVLISTVLSAITIPLILLIL